MTVQTKTIPKHRQEDVLSSFWTMMKECESAADCDGDGILKVWVEGWFRQWNQITGDDKQPAWVVRASKGQGTIT
jgi:hypothetical protein